MPSIQRVACSGPVLLRRATAALASASVMAPLCLGSTSAYAQNGPEEGSSNAVARQLQTVTVRARQSIEQRFFAAGSLVTVDRQDIEQMGAESVADVLRQLPGVQVNANGNGSIDIRMRGMDRNATQVLIDGEKVGGGGQSGQIPLDQLPSDLIERVEVLRAPSAEHSGASGGTINIVLRQPSVKSETSVRLTHQQVWGQNALQSFFSKTGPVTEPAKEPDAIPVQPWTYFLAAGALERITGSDVERQTSTFGTNPSTLTSHDAYRYRTGQVWMVPRLSGRLGPLDQLNLRGMYVGTETRGRIGSVGQGADSFGPISSLVQDQTHTERGMLQMRGDWTHRFKGSKWETFLSTQSNSEKIDRTRSQTLTQASGQGATSSQFGDDQRERMVTLSSKLTGTVDPLLWMTGADVEERKLTVDTSSSSGLGTSGPTLGFGARTRRTVLWGQNEWELPGTTTLTAGLRLENLDTQTVYNGVVVNAQRSLVQPSLHLRTPLNDDTQVRFNLARITRNPALMDLIDRRLPSQGVNTLTNPDVAGNPLLRSESSVTLDTGLEHKWGPQGQVGLNVFVRQVSDVIARRVTENSVGLWTQTPQNVGDALVWGLEADAKKPVSWPAQWGLGSDWTFSGNASLLQSRMTRGDNFGQRIPGQARYLVNLNLAKPQPQKGGWYGGTTLSLQGAADLATSATASGRELAFATLDAYVGRVVPGWGYWRLQVYNLTDSPRVRERRDVDAGGRVTADRSTLRWTPRLFFSVGTQF